MAVLKRKRKESQFEVIKHFYRFRKDVTDLLLRDFGYNEKKSKTKVNKMFGGRPYEELSDSQKEHHDKVVARNEAFEEWFIGYQRDTIMDCIRNAKLSVEDFVSCYNSWFGNHYKLMSRQQRKNMDSLFHELKEVYYV